MSIYFYKSTDASAPTLNGTVGSLISVLDACLVNGYGSKAAAGWTKEYSGTNLAAYRMSTTSPATGMYLRVDDTVTTTSRLVGYESMSDVNTGTGPFPTTAQVSGGLWLWKSNTADSVARPWAMIATNRSFYIYNNLTLTNEVLTSSVSHDTLIFFGDIISRKAVDGYQCALIAPAQAAASNIAARFGSVSAAGYSSIAGHYLARNYTGVGGSIIMGKGRNYRQLSGLTAVLGNTITDGFPNPITQSIDFPSICITESGTVYRGDLPGIYEPISGVNIAAPWYEYQGQGSMTGKNLVFVPVATTSVGGMVAIQTNGAWY
jgi:hypothetical protein